MKNSIRHIVTITATLTLSVGSAQSIPPQGDVAVKANCLEQRGDSLYVNIDLTCKGKNVPSRSSIDYLPELVTSERSQMLPAVSIQGRYAYKFDRRTKALQGKKSTTLINVPYAVIRGYKKGSQTINYQFALSYESWMSSARLDLLCWERACGNTVAKNSVELVSAITLEQVTLPELYKIAPHFAFISPEVEPIKNRSTQSETLLSFASLSTDLDPRYGQNALILNQLEQTLNEVSANKNATLRGLRVIGYASPDGFPERNQQLAEARAQSLKNYLLQRQNHAENLYQAVCGGEDWVTFEKLVRASDLQAKEEILAIITNETLDRKKVLMALHAGVPYRQMVRELFPLLRRVVVEVDYQVRSFTPEEAKVLVKTRPQDLSVNELFVIAAEYQVGSADFNHLFDVAVLFHQNSPVVNTNAAVVALTRQDFAAAQRYLDKVQMAEPTPVYNNAMGLLLMLRDGDYDAAEHYFQLAQAAGLVEAGGNLVEISRKRQEHESAK